MRLKKVTVCQKYIGLHFQTVQPCDNNIYPGGGMKTSAAKYKLYKQVNIFTGATCIAAIYILHGVVVLGEPLRCLYSLSMFVLFSLSFSFLFLTSTWPHLRCDVGLEEGEY